MNNSVISANTNAPYIFSQNDWEMMYPKDDYKKQTSHVKEHLIHYLLALNFKDETVNNEINKPQSAKRLTKQDSRNHELTPLIIATMKGRIGIVRVLLGISKSLGKLEQDINIRDKYKWTAYHHAALRSPKLLELFQGYGVSLNGQTPLYATPLDLKRLIGKDVTYSHLSRLFFEDPDSGEVYALSTKGTEILCQKTGLSTYCEFPFLPKSEYKNYWQGKNPSCNPEEQRRNKQYLSFALQNSSCSLVVGKSSLLEGSFCWELRAKEMIPFGKVIGEYGGEVIENCYRSIKTVAEWYELTKNRESGYLFAPVDAAHVGNVTRWINWGFPNCAILPLESQGLLRNYFVCLEKEGIQSEEPLLFDYGVVNLDGLFHPFALFGLEKMQAHFKPGLKNLLKEIDNEIVMTFSRLGGKFLFPLSAPSALLNLHFEGIVEAKDWLVNLEDLKRPHALISNWRTKYTWNTGMITRVLLRINEWEEKLQSCPKQKRDAAVEWILSSIGRHSVVHILKGMDLIQKEILFKEMEEIEQTLEEILADYDWTEDADAPISIRRYGEDMGAIYMKNYGNAVFPTLLKKQEEFAELGEESLLYQLNYAVIEFFINKNKE